MYPRRRLADRLTKPDDRSGFMEALHQGFPHDLFKIVRYGGLAKDPFESASFTNEGMRKGVTIMAKQGVFLAKPSFRISLKGNWFENALIQGDDPTSTTERASWVYPSLMGASFEI
jgi:hypothetical protein